LAATGSRRRVVTKRCDWGRFARFAEVEEARAAGERDDLDEIVPRSRPERFSDYAPRVFERVVCDGIADVDEQHGANARSLRGLDRTSERKTHREEQGHAKEERENPLLPWKIGQRPRERQYEQRKHGQHDEEPRLTERKRLVASRPLESRGREVPDVPEIGDTQQRGGDHGDRRQNDEARAAQTVTLRW
jgi:hypothetical protein